MSTEQWIALGAILVPVALAGATAVFGIVGYFMRSDWVEAKARIRFLESQNQKNRERLVRIETYFAHRGILLPQIPEEPSPIMRIEDGAG